MYMYCMTLGIDINTASMQPKLYSGRDFDNSGQACVGSTQVALLHLCAYSAAIVAAQLPVQILWPIEFHWQSIKGICLPQITSSSGLQGSGAHGSGLTPQRQALEKTPGIYS